MALISFCALVVTISLSGVMAPGPITAITLARGRRDPLAGLWINIGHAISEVPLIAALIAGLKPLLESQDAYRGISIAGGLFMLWMGINLTWKAPGKNPAEGTKYTRWGPIYEGLITTALNPYWFFWWLTIGGSLIAKAETIGTPQALMLMILLHLSCDVLWGTFLSFSANRGGNVIRPETWGWIQRGCGLVLLLFAVFFLKGGFDNSFKNLP